MANTPEYYVLGVEDPDEGHRARLIYTRDQPLRSWMSGAPFEHPPPEPIVLTLRGTDEEGWVLGDLWLTPITVMSKRLLQALRGAGVDNLTTYAVDLRDPHSGKVYEEFVAFHLIGTIAAADRAKTRFAPGVQETGVAADLDALAVDPAKAGGALMFRLAESVNTIVVHESVCAAIEAAGIDTLTFYEPEDVAT